MRSWLNERSWPSKVGGLLLTASGALCVAVGCQSGGNFDALEREIRWKEDRIYYLEDDVKDYKKQLASARRENETLRRDLESSQGGGSAAPWNPGADGASIPSAPPSESGPAGLPPVGGMGSGGAGSAGDAPSFDDEPIISPPGTGVPEGIAVPGGSSAPLTPPAGSLPDLGPPGGGESQLPAPAPGGGAADSTFDRALPDDAPASGLSFRLGPDEVMSVDTSAGSHSASPADDDSPAGSFPPFGPPPHGESPSSASEELLPPPPLFEDVSLVRPKKQVSSPGNPATVNTTYPLPANVDQVAKVTLNGLLTGGHDTSDTLGDEGVLVVVEPRNTADEIVDVAGEVEIAIIDPQLSGTDREVARWRFAPGEAADRFRETILGAGMHFDLPWPNRPPKNAELQLHVRYTTPEGEKFTLKEEIKVDPPGAEATALEHPSAGKRARLLPPRAVDVPRSQAQSRQRMARIGRPRFHGSDQQQRREQRQPDGQPRSSGAGQPTPHSTGQAETQLAPPAWTPYR